MKEQFAKVRWGVERRLEFIEFRLLWEGGVNRSDIRNAFDVSEPQASKDLTLYQERAPGNAVYDKTAKRYIASETFQPVYLGRGPSEYLQRLRSLGEGLNDPTDSWITDPPEIDITLTPEREVITDCLRAVLKAYRERQSVDIFYQSMSKNRPEPIWRRITPHAFGYDGFRWHIRAYCHLTDRFKDFLLPRILESGRFHAAGMPGSGDTLWQELFGIVVSPHPDLGATQQAIVAKDYGMTNGTTILKVRYAMLFYVLKRLNLLGEAEKKPARSQHIVVVNSEETEKALRRAEYFL
jgi:hypothetical protein